MRMEPCIFTMRLPITRMHVAVSTIDKLVDYCMNTPADGLTTTASVETLKKLIDRNLPLLK